MVHRRWEKRDSGRTYERGSVPTDVTREDPTSEMEFGENYESGATDSHSNVLTTHERECRSRYRTKRKVGLRLEGLPSLVRTGP